MDASYDVYRGSLVLFGWNYYIGGILCLLREDTQLFFTLKNYCTSQYLTKILMNGRFKLDLIYGRSL
jgi:hypothetical protein